MTPTAIYHFRSGKDLSLKTVGRLEKAGDMYVLRAAAKVDDVFQLDRHMKAGGEATVQIEVGDEIVAIMPVIRWRAKPDGAGRFEIQAIVG